ncbi:MAG TPA: efflux RND transporter periplasmic adaptor subunit [Chthoniobacterales bacterium]|jgi:HlyD family secretion protein
MKRSSVVALVLLSLSLLGCQKKPNDFVQGYVEGEFVYVSAPLGGTLQQLLVQRGDEVKAGQPLFTLDETKEKAAHDQAQAALTMAEADFKRQEQLYRSGPAAAQDFDRARSTRDQDREQVAQAQWNLAQMKQDAPQAGLVFDTLFREGEWVAAGKPIVSLLPPANIKVRAFVPETEVGSLHFGQEARVMVDGVGEPFVGRISYISPRAEYTPPVIYSRESRSKLVFLVEIRFEPAVAVKLHPGQPVDVAFVRQ